MLLSLQSPAEELRASTINLPPLRINGQPAKAHTQGLEVISTNYYVTARRDDVQPKRALLLRTGPNRTDWDVWDITPVDAQGALTKLDHPGGMQSDGERLWIPLAESKRNGKSLIRAFPIAGMIPGQPLKAEMEFPVDDHIGALAVLPKHKMIFGANWDTEAVYIWDFAGHLQRTVGDEELNKWGIGPKNAYRPGRLAVQDWKGKGNEILASGLVKGPDVGPDSTKSFVVGFDPISAKFEPLPTPLKKHNGVELAREAMAFFDGRIYFIPEDLGETNRVFQYPGRSTPQPSK